MMFICGYKSIKIIIDNMIHDCENKVISLLYLYDTTFELNLIVKINNLPLTEQEKCLRKIMSSKLFMLLHMV